MNNPLVYGSFQSGNNWGAIFSSRLAVMTAGYYIFHLELGPADTAEVQLDGRTVLSKACNWGSATIAGTGAWVEAGIHSLRVVYMDDGYTDAMQLTYMGPDTNNERVSPGPNLRAPPAGCCMHAEAKCYACAAGVTEAQFCAGAPVEANGAPVAATVAGCDVSATPPPPPPPPSPPRPRVYSVPSPMPPGDTAFVPDEWYALDVTIDANGKYRLQRNGTAVEKGHPNYCDLSRAIEKNGEHFLTRCAGQELVIGLHEMSAVSTSSGPRAGRDLQGCAEGAVVQELAAHDLPGQDGVEGGRVVAHGAAAGRAGQRLRLGQGSGSYSGSGSGLCSGSY